VIEQWRGGPATALLPPGSPPIPGRSCAHLPHAPCASRRPADAGALFRDAYADRPFVRVLDRPPELTHAVGTNAALVHAASAPGGREALVHVAIDNLVKGRGQAVQAMNLSLGFEEGAGLRLMGMFPC